MNNSKIIVLTGGGTAGHVTPHIALLPCIKYDFNEIHYIGSKNGIERELIEKLGIKYHPITTVKLKRNISLSNLKIPYLLNKGISECKKLLEEIKPDVVFSKGGFVSVPVLKACAKLKIPYITHESDLSIGLANKMTYKKSYTLLTTFNETAKKYNGQHCGSPIKDEFFMPNRTLAKQELNFKSQKPTLLFMGGSLGSKIINETLAKAINDLAKTYNIVHITGKGNQTMIKNESYRQMEFTTKIQDYIALSDLVICRSGSNTINELLTIKKPMLLIPLSRKASRGDQIQNAMYFKNQGYAYVLNEEDLSPRTLVVEIFKAWDGRNNLISNMTTARLPNSKKIIINILNEVANLKKT